MSKAKIHPVVNHKYPLRISNHAEHLFPSFSMCICAISLDTHSGVTTSNGTSISNPPGPLIRANPNLLTLIGSGMTFTSLTGEAPALPICWIGSGKSNTFVVGISSDLVLLGPGILRFQLEM